MRFGRAHGEQLLLVRAHEPVREKPLGGPYVLRRPARHRPVCRDEEAPCHPIQATVNGVRGTHFNLCVVKAVLYAIERN